MSLPVWLPGPMFLTGVAVWFHVPSIDRDSPGQTPPLDRDPSGQRHPLDRDHPSWTETPPHRTIKSRRFASYCNAFRFRFRSIQQKQICQRTQTWIFLSGLLFIQTISDPRGRPLNIFHILAGFEKKWANNRLTPPSLKLASLEILDPPLLSLFQVLDPPSTVALPVDLDLD